MPLSSLQTLESPQLSVRVRNRINWEPADLASSNSRDPETGIFPPKHLKRHLRVPMFMMNIAQGQLGGSVG